MSSFVRVCRRVLRPKSLKTAFVDELILIVCVTLRNVSRQGVCGWRKEVDR